MFGLSGINIDKTKINVFNRMKSSSMQRYALIWYTAIWDTSEYKFPVKYCAFARCDFFFEKRFSEKSEFPPLWWAVVESTRFMGRNALNLGTTSDIFHSTFPN